MAAAAELQALVFDNKEKIIDDGFYLALSNAAMKVYERASALDEDPDDACDEEEQDEDEEMEDWEDGDRSARSIAAQYVDEVKLDEDDFVDLINGLHVHAFTRTRRPKACAMAMVELLKGLDIQDASDVAKLRNWKEQIIMQDGHGRFGYILKQTWLDDDYENGEDSDPRAHIMEIMALLIEKDRPFADLMRVRGNLRALKEIVDQSNIAHLRDEACRVIAKLE